MNDDKKDFASQKIDDEKRAAQLGIENKELALQIEQKEKRAAELIIVNSELVFQIGEQKRRNEELTIAIQQANDEKIMVQESIEDGFFATDKHSLITYWNGKAESLLGAKKEYILGKTLYEIFGESPSPIFYDNFQKALRENTAIRFEGFSNRAQKWFSVSAFAFDNGLSVYFKDVTELKNEEEKLKETENLFQAIIEKSTELITLTTIKGHVVYISPSITKTFGYKFEDFGTKTLFSFFHPDDLKEFEINRKNILKAHGSFFDYQLRVLHKNGQWVWCECTLTNMLEEPGVIALVKNFRDITKRKESEKLIQASEAKYRSFFESSIDGILLTVTDGKILSANPAACEIFNMTEPEICAAGRMGLVDLSDPRLYALLEERKQTGRAKGELTLLRKDGSKFEAELTSAVFTDSSGQTRTSMIVRDVSERKEVEFKLNQTSKELQHILHDLNKIMDSSIDIICVINEAGRFVQMSAASQAIWGYSPQELINVNLFSMLYADDIEKTEAISIKIQRGVPASMFENRYVHKNGSIIPMLWSASWDENDKLMYCIGKDATEKKKLEKAYEIERQRFLELYFQAPSCMGILKGPNHVYELANPLYLQLIDRSDIIGKTVKEVLPELESQGIFDFLDTVYTTGNTFSANEMRVQFDHKGTGELVDTYLNFIYQAHRDNEGQIDGIVFFAIDVTEQVLSRRKIEESEKRYRQIVETAQEGIWVIDENHKTTFVNSKMCEILEYSEAEMMGKDIYFFMDEEGKEIASELKKKNKQGHAGHGNKKYRSKTGKEIWANISSNPLFYDDETYKGSLAMVTDITERKLAEENIISTAKSLKLALAEQVVLRQKTEDSEARLKEAQAIAHLGHWVLNLKTYLAEWSDEACRIYGLAVEDNIISYTDWLSFIHPEDLEYVKKSIEKSPETSLESTLNFRILLKDGAVKYIASTSRIEYDEFGVPFEMYGISFDITLSKLAEIRLKNLNEDLQVQAKELAISNLELEQFAYVASHDLQEPLRMITSFLKLLEKKYGATIDNKGRQYIGFAVDGAYRMRQIILDLLELSRVGKTEENREDINLNDLVEEVNILYRKMIKEKNALIISEPLPHVSGFRSRLLQVFQNLIGNALKYSSQERRANINITSTEFVDHWQIAIQDNGIGIEQEYFEKIFIIFQRLHTRDQFSGTGMGLALTKKILENQGGKIWVKSEEGKGSTFYFTLLKRKK